MKDVACIDDSEVLERIDEYQQLPTADKRAAKARLLREFPRIADDLAACLNGLDLIEGVADDLKGADDRSPQLVPSSITDPEDLGDFTIVREIGRGGMGVVYEARQRSLGRRVALKVLPFASFLDPVRLQRFKQEAQAAAVLHHPNIVPVHCVGTERGVHFYAMEFIDGRSLAEIILELRPPATKTLGNSSAAQEDDCHAQSELHTKETTPNAVLSTAYSQDRKSFFQRAARLGIQVAEALHYAHQQGIVHRDIKPSNLMVDVKGQPWVTDFGLAQTQDDHGLTMTGDLLGTLRYMSPEQADGRKLLDPRTDVYSLGATLYELVTLVPAIHGENRHQILGKIAERQVKHPRAVDATIPRDLEKILLKAMAHDVQDRYESAELFALDLRRSLDGQPVSARPTGRLQKALRWVNRHRLASGLVSLVTTLLLTLAVLGQVLAAEAQEAEREAERSNEELIGVLSSTLDSLVQTVENVPDNEFVKYELITDTLANFERLLRQDPNSQQLRFHAAKAYDQLSWAGGFRFAMKKNDEIDWLRKAEEIAESLVRVSPENTEYQELLGNIYWRLGNHPEFVDANDYFQRCKTILDALLKADPENNQYLFYMANTLGWQAMHEWEEGDEATYAKFEEAEQLYEKVISKVPENDDYRCIYGYVLTHRANRMASKEQRHADAVRIFRRALALYGQDFSKSLIVTRVRIGRGQALRQLGVSLSRLGQLHEAERHLRRSVHELAEVRSGFPQSSWAHQEYMDSRRRLIENLVAQKRNPEALAEAKGLLAKWGSQDTVHKWLNRGDIQYLAGRILWWQGDIRKALEYFREASCGPLDFDTHQHLLTQCAEATYRKPREAFATSERDHIGRIRFAAEAHFELREWQDAIDVLSARVNEGTADGLDFFRLAIAAHHVGDQASAMGWYEQGLERLDQSATWNEMFYWMELRALREQAAELMTMRMPAETQKFHSQWTPMNDEIHHLEAHILRSDAPR